uniref:Glutamate-rich WD repeat-containing protein 1 n=1 Tax=Amorphochlora amoebiformis TaxID=1561963 RepID=A0A7S0H7L9_9EUKA
MEEERKESKAEKSLWRPGVDRMEEGEQLDYDPSTYITYHDISMEWPCLSIDVIRDPLGIHRTKFPMELFLVAGSQAAQASQNKVYLMKVSNIQKTYDENEMEEEDPEEPEYEQPNVDVKSFKHDGGINRIRVMPQAANIIATMSDTKNVHLWDTQNLLTALDFSSSAAHPASSKPLHTFSGHSTEGFALDWSPTVPGRLLTGDCSKYVYLWEKRESGWVIDKTPYNGHTDSVEDIQWSPVEKDVFATCSVDKTVRIWDTRRRKSSMLFVAAHQMDVNVISWNTNKPHLMLSGSDDGSFKVWDLRKFKSSLPSGHFTYHRGPITSIQWHPTEEAMLAVASADNQLSIWDLALEDEVDSKSIGANANVSEIPPQLLFVHQGQQNVKELRFHPQIPGVIISTAQSGLNIFKPCNL